MSAFKLANNKQKLSSINSVKQLSSKKLKEILENDNSPKKYKAKIVQELSFR